MNLLIVKVLNKYFHFNNKKKCFTFMKQFKNNIFDSNSINAFIIIFHIIYIARFYLQNRI